MNILVACEESQIVCKAFRNKGHRAFSCDIQECSGGHPEWHILGDVLPLLNGNCEFILQNGEKDKQIGKWDMILAFPPCTHLAISGASWFEKKREDGRQREAIEFFGKMLMADCDKIVVENPINIINGIYLKKYFPDLCEKYGFPIEPTQRIQPWWFGENVNKTTCLWIKGLPPLIPDVTEKPKMEKKKWYNEKQGKMKSEYTWSYDLYCRVSSKKELSKLRSKTFQGIANAMAKQWG